MDNTRIRGQAFLRILNRIVKPNRRIGNDLFLFDQYSLNPLLKKAFVTDCTIAIEVTSGHGITVVNTVSYHFEAPCIIILLPKQMIQYIADENEGSTSKVMVMSEKFMKDFNAMSLHINDIYSTLMLNPVISLDRGSVYEMDIFTKMLTTIVRKRRNPSRFNSAKLLCTSLFYNTICDAVKVENRGSNRTTQISQDFMELVKKHFRQEHRLDFYASKLCITDRYLYMAVKTVTGRTANYWLNYYLITEAMILLRTTDLDIQEISDLLNFPAQSNFGKFFKRQTGQSPNSYRKSQE